MNQKKKRMKPRIFLRNYGRLLIGGTIIAMVLFFSVFASQLATHDPYAIDMKNIKQLPSEEHYFGTDIYGRDLYSRVLYGGMTTLIVAVGTQVVSVLAGTVLGLICGYYKWAEKVLMRILDAFNTLPSIILCLLMVSVLGAGVPNLIVAMAVGKIPNIARMIRNQVLSLKEKEYIESETAMGAGAARTLFLHILPSCSSYLTVNFTAGLGGAILSMTSLSYLGLGLDPTIPSWGGIIKEGSALIYGCPHLVLYASIAICITVFGFTLLGDGVRDLLDPKTR